jgi:hypothetical protein
MTQPRTPRSPRSAAPKLRAVPATDAPAPKPAAKPPRDNGWTLAKQAAFLRALSASHSVSEAARSVGKSRQSAYQLRSKLKGQPFDLAWEVAFHHSYDVLAHTALERALNGVEVPVFFQGEQVGAYRRFDERLTVALLSRFTMGGNPAFGRLGPMAERHARDFEALLAKLEAGEAVATGALSPQDPDEFAGLRGSFGDEEKGGFPCPSSMSDDELMKVLQENGWEGDA